MTSTHIETRVALGKEVQRRMLYNINCYVKLLNSEQMQTTACCCCCWTEISVKDTLFLRMLPLKNVEDYTSNFPSDIISTVCFLPQNINKNIHLL